MFDLGELWPLAFKRLTWGQIWQLVPDSLLHCASSAFCRSKLSLLVRAPDRLKQSAARFGKKCKHFALMTSLDLEVVDPRSPNLYHKEFLCGPTHPPSFVFLTLLGAEIAGGRICPPPSKARKSQTLSRGRVNTISGRGCLNPPLRLFGNLQNDWSWEAEIVWLLLKLSWAYFLKSSSW